MTILNYNEKTLSLVFDYKFDEEQTKNLLSAIIAAIRWNSLCNNDNKFDIDGENVCTLTLLLDRLNSSSLYENDSLVLNIPAIEPKKEKDKIFKAIIAAFRWNSICDISFKTQEDSQHVIFMASFLDQLIKSKEIFD